MDLVLSNMSNRNLSVVFRLEVSERLRWMARQVSYYNEGELYIPFAATGMLTDVYMGKDLHPLSSNIG